MVRRIGNSTTDGASVSGGVDILFNPLESAFQGQGGLEEVVVVVVRVVFSFCFLFIVDGKLCFLDVLHYFFKFLPISNSHYLLSRARVASASMERDREKWERRMGKCVFSLCFPLFTQKVERN